MKMLNCPFCNKQVKGVETDLGHEARLRYFIICINCNLALFGPEKKGKKHLIRKWNKRYGC